MLRTQNRLVKMRNSCLYQIRRFSCLGISAETLKSAILDSKQLFINQMRCLGGAETSQSAILDGKQLFNSNQMLRTEVLRPQI